MNRKLFYIGLLINVFLSSLHFTANCQDKNSLPSVFASNHSDLVKSLLRKEALQKFSLHQLPTTLNEWRKYRSALKKKIIAKTGVLVHQNLPLLVKETGVLKMKGYSIKNIAFQTRPAVFATANLYIPDGNEKFPAVIVMMGHSPLGKLYDTYQSVGITLALHGYVSLCIDPWGSGERTTTHGDFEDHGDQNNLGSALLNIGEPLIGLQITDNIRGVDLLCSLPYVDTLRIGATGSSGGGNQTMWLAALDERIKAAVPVVSAGTFEAYVMGSPCICEVLDDTLTFTEEAGILSLIAPRALKMCNHSKDDLYAFKPTQMLRSYHNAAPVFAMMGVKNNIAYDTFNLAHGYWPEDRIAMLSWFNLYLKGMNDKSPVQEESFSTLPAEQLMVYTTGNRDSMVMSTAGYCKQKGNELRNEFLHAAKLDADIKRNQLKNILRINQQPHLKKVHSYQNTGGWSRYALETDDDKLIPVLFRAPSSPLKDVTIVCDVAGKQHLSQGLIDQLIKSGSGVAIIDLSGTGETASSSLNSGDSIGRLRTLFKSYLLLGKTPMGEWVKELNTVVHFIRLKYKRAKINFYGIKEAGLAGLFVAALQQNIDTITLENAPMSYLFDNRESIEFFSSCINVPGLLNWGDVSLAAGLTGSEVRFIGPVRMSGTMIDAEELKKYNAEFAQIKKRLGLQTKQLKKRTR